MVINTLIWNKIRMLDNTDRKILSLLQKDARMPNAEIARRLKMAPSGILERLRKLKDRDIIKEYVAHLDPKALDFGLLAFVYIKTNEKRVKWDVGKIVSKIPGVLEVHDIAGDECYVVKLRTKDTESLYRLLRDDFGSIDAIASTRTTIVLRTLKETSDLPLELKGEASTRSKRED
jgi:Lrp/AsnC family leucine-responsive transcriptional regulator